VLRSHAELDRPARELMTRAPQTIRDTALVRDAVNIVREHRRDEIPVVDGDGRPVGILDVQDLIAMRLIEAE
jgi:arabinose-5-phosphate isomerase